MSYVNTLEYKIMPAETFKIIRGCAGCGCKQTFSSKNRFRINANGNRLDIWLIYACDQCGHTYNLSIYERVRPDRLSKQDYQKFLANDEETAFHFGTEKSVFVKNKAEIDWSSVRYEITSICDKKIVLETDTIRVKLYNPYDLPVRADKILAYILQISRSRVRDMMHEGKLSAEMVRHDKQQHMNNLIAEYNNAIMKNHEEK